MNLAVPENFPACDLNFSEYTRARPRRARKFANDMLKNMERHCLGKASFSVLNPRPPNYRTFQMADKAQYRKGVQNWIQVEGKRFRFLAAHDVSEGADVYIDDINALIL
ncbi:putative methyltransferase PMT18 [Ananas comosus]|uniref:Putative methyltransferase PMT18 n=1 Tax=Ananas comosus TaxID=4615 RepID=A0A199UUU2_ANACO|nr:putative methyltransferase PMT18 [Ananas comosus]